MKKIQLFGTVSLCGALIAGTPLLADAQKNQAAQTSETQTRQEQRSSQNQERTSQERQSQERTSQQRQQAGEREVSREAREAAPDGAEVKESAEMVLNEEELDVQTRQVPVGGILLRKRVVQEDGSETVELRREEIEVVRLSPEEAEQQQSRGGEGQGFGEAFTEGEIFIPLMREEANADKEVRTRQVVRAQPETRTEEEEFNATLRREEVEVERVGDLENEQVQQRDGAREGSDQQQVAQQQDTESSSDNMERQIRDRLQSGDVELSQQQLQELEIEIEEATVRLSGEVPSEQIKQQIEEVVQAVSGVENVENELEIS